jgi:hypothetical protein
VCIISLYNTYCICTLCNCENIFCAGVFHEDPKGGQTETAPDLMNASPDIERYLRVQIVNNAIREIFLNQFAHMFSVYEYFFTQPNQV